MSKLPRYTPGQTPLTARDLNTMVEEIKRLKRLSVAPPLEMSPDMQIRLRRGMEPFLAVIVATPDGESELEDYRYYAERIWLTSVPLDDSLVLPYTQAGEWFVVTNLAERIYDGSEWFGSHMLETGDIIDVRAIAGVSGDHGYLTNTPPRNGYIAEVDSTINSLDEAAHEIPAKMLKPDGTEYSANHPWGATTITVDVPANGPGGKRWPWVSAGVLIAVAKHGTGWVMTGVMAEVAACS